MAGSLSPFHLPIRAKEMANQIDSSLVTLKIFENAGAPVYSDAPKEAADATANFLKSCLT